MSKILSEKALTYFQSRMKGRSERDKKNLLQLCFNKKLNLKNFGSHSFIMDTFDWENGHDNRNWWWQMQSLPFLGWIANSYNIMNNQEFYETNKHCIKYLKIWMDRANKKHSPLVWHDHAASIRLNNLLNWTLAIYYKDASECLTSIMNEIDVEGLLYTHMAWLAEEKNYSKNTNHGFDQSFYLLASALSTKSKKSEWYADLARARLVSEVEHAFTDQGVHKENSPGYQKYMLGRIKGLKDFRIFNESELVNLTENYLEKINSFLNALTLPNGTLPVIGDTLGHDKGGSDTIKKDIKVHDYSRSGYVIIKGYLDGKEFSFIFKNTHESNYHRHDDDLSIHLYFNGNVLIGDGGLYSHNEKDKKRIHLRSAFSHSVPLCNRNAVRDRSLLLEKPSVTLNKEKLKVVGESHMFGCKIIREIDLSKINTGKIKIRDSVDKMGLYQNFFLPYLCDKSEILGNTVKINTGDNAMKMKFLKSSGTVSFYSGWNRALNQESAIFSDTFGEFRPATRLVTSGTTIETEIFFYEEA